VWSRFLLSVQCPLLAELLSCGALRVGPSRQCHGGLRVRLQHLARNHVGLNVTSVMQLECEDEILTIHFQAGVTFTSGGLRVVVGPKWGIPWRSSAGCGSGSAIAREEFSSLAPPPRWQPPTM